MLITPTHQIHCFNSFNGNITNKDNKTCGAKIITEYRNEDTRDIDILPTVEMIKKINDEDKKVAVAVEKEIPNIAKAVDTITEQFRKGGRLYYFGAGTSGRLGILDASECPPTFGVNSDLVQGVIAGGETAIRNAVEGAEDNYEMGIKDAERLKENDVCVVISASGNPKYLLGVLEQAKKTGAKTIAITCNPKGKILEAAEQGICTVVGPEAITGSSRMKAGTSQKMVLNMLSTGAMIKSGKTYENLMIDVMPTNIKLRDRASRIVSEIADVDKEYARNMLENSDWKVKTAITRIKGNMNKDEANQLLEDNNGILRKALDCIM